MSTATRRGDRGLGRTAAGGNAGSFAGHERAPAAALVVTPGPLTLSKEGRAQRRAELAHRAEQIHRQLVAAALSDIASAVHEAHPDAHTLVFGIHGGDSEPWLAAAVTEDGTTEVPLDPELQDELSQIAHVSIGSGDLLFVQDRTEWAYVADRVARVRIADAEQLDADHELRVLAQRAAHN